MAKDKIKITLCADRAKDKTKATNPDIIRFPTTSVVSPEEFKEKGYFFNESIFVIEEEEQLL